MRGKLSAFMYNAIKKKTVVEVELDGNQCEQLEKLKDKDISAEFKIFREKRSLSANAYAWTLINKLADVMDQPSIEIYRQHIKDMGVYRDIDIDEKAENTLITVWQAYGLGWLAERVDFARKDGYITLRLYYGSSVYNTKQMSRFIDGIVQDCKALGIETMTPAEIERLIQLSERM
ncbi:MAG: hypothetical protein IKU47_08035 [Oscillospiraceae bacterium]|nr:hypothetical protein [Oscillospiraceae bacterium]